MTEIAKDKWGRITQTVIAMLGGAILTMMFTTANETKANTSDIAVIKAQVQPLIGINERLSSLEIKADRNYDMLIRVQTAMETHVSKDK